MKTNTEFLRLVNNEPLVLAVSALSDFLWDDFIRDARPIVRYLEDKYNIKQLSRFGKELFDFLYNGGQVTTVINFDEVESYFRAKQNGQNPDLVATEYSFESAIFFFEKNKLWAICDQGINDAAITSLTKRINGGTHGLDDRKEKTKKFAAMVGA